MAVNQIPVPTGNPWGDELLTLRRAYLSFRQQQHNLRLSGAAMLAKLTAMKDGNDYTRIESQLNLQVGQGTTLYAELNSVVGNFGDDTKTQAQVIAAVDQFNGFIG